VLTNLIAMVQSLQFLANKFLMPLLHLYSSTRHTVFICFNVILRLSCYQGILGMIVCPTTRSRSHFASVYSDRIWKPSSLLTYS